MLLYSAITPKKENKYVVKVFNWSEVHLSKMTLLQNPYFSLQCKWKGNQKRKGIDKTTHSGICSVVITYVEYFGSTTLVVTNGAHSAAWLPTDCCSSSSLAKRGVGEGQKARWPSFATSYYWHRSVIHFHRFIHDIILRV